MRTRNKGQRHPKRDAISSTRLLRQAEKPKLVAGSRRPEVPRVRFSSAPQKDRDAHRGEGRTPRTRSARAIRLPKTAKVPGRQPVHQGRLFK